MCGDYHVVALDHRGHGDSDRAAPDHYRLEDYLSDVEALVESAALRDIVLVGHSAGGRDAFLYAVRHPDAVKALVVVDIDPDAVNEESIGMFRRYDTEPDEWESLDAVVEYMNQQNRFASDAVLRRRLTYGTKELPNGKIGWRYDILIREQRRQGTVPPNNDLWPELPKITGPALVVRGMETDVLSIDVAHRMLDIMPNAQLVEIPQAGHMVFEDNPVDFISAVRSFLV